MHKHQTKVISPHIYLYNKIRIDIELKNIYMIYSCKIENKHLL